LNQAFFDGLCDLVLGGKAFPFKLEMPASLGWKDKHLWLFPSQIWHLAPHLWGENRDRLSNPCWANDYENGRVATVDEISHLFVGEWPSKRRLSAERAVSKLHAHINDANNDLRHRVRINLAMAAQRAFLFLFLANTGCNLAVAREIETDGSVDASAVNQTYRAIKFRARGREISVVVPVAFMPKLRRFLELRQYLLMNTKCTTLFFTLNDGPNKAGLGPIHEAALFRHYNSLSRIQPALPRISAKKIRATVADFYRRTYDGSTAASVLGHSETVAERNYLSGSPVAQKKELTLFLEKVSATARNQKVLPISTGLESAKSLEEGGKCERPGDPQALDIGMQTPNCRQGCLFCKNRILVANEQDARKVASAAFLMEQLISGPLSEAEFRPQIKKCDDDLEKIAAVGKCHEMVKSVKRDVYENGNLTEYFSDKYQVFLELGVL